MVQHLAVMVGNQIRGHYVSESPRKDGVQACVFVQSDTRRGLNRLISSVRSSCSSTRSLCSKLNSFFIDLMDLGQT